MAVQRPSYPNVAKSILLQLLLLLLLTYHWYYHHHRSLRMRLAKGVALPTDCQFKVHRKSYLTYTGLVQK